VRVLPDKRERLIRAGRDMIYRQGYAPTTLAQIAEAASVPLGNVYYYFKTKEAIAEAVIDARLAELRAALERAERKQLPEERLAALLEIQLEGCDEVARRGCPYGSLAQELEKRDGPLGSRAALLVEVQREWMERQFLAMGLSQRARDLALELLCAAQGAALVAHALGDAGVMHRRLRDLEAWIQGLAREATLTD